MNKKVYRAVKEKARWLIKNIFTVTCADIRVTMQSKILSF